MNGKFEYDMQAFPRIQRHKYRFFSITTKHMVIKSLTILIILGFMCEIHFNLLNITERNVVM